MWSVWYQLFIYLNKMHIDQVAVILLFPWDQLCSSCPYLLYLHIYHHYSHFYHYLFFCLDFDSSSWKLTQIILMFLVSAGSHLWYLDSLYLCVSCHFMFLKNLWDFFEEWMKRHFSQGDLPMLLPVPKALPNPGPIQNKMLVWSCSPYR